MFSYFLIHIAIPFLLGCAFGYICGYLMGRVDECRFEEEEETDD